MDQVWSWDHCFNALALAKGHPDLAWDQFMLPFDHQDVHGALPDSVNDLVMHFNFSKPPVHGWTLRRLWRSNPALVTRERLDEVYNVLVRWTEWWLTARTWPEDTLPHYLHGNDSGWDNSTIFDGGTPLVAPDLAAFLVLQTEELADLAETLGKPAEAEQWRGRSKRLLEALLAKLWRTDRFVAVRQPSGEAIDTQSLILCLPIVLGKRLPAEVRGALIKRIGTFVTKFGLATEHPDSPHYLPDGYWRGPIWAPSTMLIVDGLVQSDEKALAERIAQRFCRMCAKSGFAENFDALTGEALRDRAYTWTSSVFLLLASELLRK
ncbi:MAG TPA: trehalase family glycosidase, partial [Planctomycetota bacterium]|nr:trehalase family glycosidase [Planctomycetota bacterium]